MNPRTRALAIWVAAAVVLVAVIAVRNRPAEPEPDLYAAAGPYPGSVYPVAAPTTVSLTAPAPTTTVVPGPAATTEEAHPGPATTAAPTEADAVAATATGFLHGWVLRGTWEERAQALKTVTTATYLPQIEFIEPDLVGLPPGQIVTADPAQVTITEAGSATVPAVVDGFRVTVYEVRTAAREFPGDTGWRVDSHGKG